jgi:hypothetical protein
MIPPLPKFPERDTYLLRFPIGMADFVRSFNAIALAFGLAAGVDWICAFGEC